MHHLLQVYQSMTTSETSPLQHHVLPLDDIDAWRHAISELKDEADAVRERASAYSIEIWAKRHQEAYDSLF